MQKKRKTIIVAVSVILAVAVLAVCITVPTLYENGLLGDIHPMIKAKDGQIRVACVGDSLTYGMRVEGWSKNNYPTKLGKMLGNGYCVNNFGYSGRTAGTYGDRPYTSEKLYGQSLDFAPEIVVIMLGSNDTKEKNWQGKERYIEEYTEIINTYLSLDSVKKLYIMTPSPIWAEDGNKPYGIIAEIIENELIPAIHQIAQNLELELIDLYTLFKDKQRLFKDNVHPNAEGAQMIADAVYAAITA